MTAAALSPYESFMNDAIAFNEKYQSKTVSYYTRNQFHQLESRFQALSTELLEDQQLAASELFKTIQKIVGTDPFKYRLQKLVARDSLSRMASSTVSTFGVFNITAGLTTLAAYELKGSVWATATLCTLVASRVIYHNLFSKQKPAAASTAPGAAAQSQIPTQVKVINCACKKTFQGIKYLYSCVSSRKPAAAHSHVRPAAIDRGGEGSSGLELLQGIELPSFQPRAVRGPDGKVRFMFEIIPSNPYQEAHDGTHS